MKALVRRLLERIFAPLYLRLDVLADLDRDLAVRHGELSERIDALSRRIESMEQILQTMEGRAATLTERQSGYEEDQFRLVQRLESIESLLAEAPHTSTH
jgi:TolA-binding protein